MAYDEIVRLKNGGVAILRHGGRRPKQVSCACGRPSTLQCDYPTSKGTTCSKFMCRACAGPPRSDGTDYCREHREQTP